MALVLLVVAAACAALVAGCGSSSTVKAPAFGPAPPPVAGVHAWAVGEVGHVLFTDDGGASWHRRAFNLPDRGTDVAFADPLHGWLVTDGGTALATGDGGATWTVGGQSHLNLSSVASTDADHVWALGDATDVGTGLSRSSVLRSADGGQTWVRTGFGTTPLADTFFADARHGWLVGFDRIWATADGGKTWRVQERRGLAALEGGACSDRRHAWVVGWGTQDGAPLALGTSDGGATWRELRVDVPKPARGDLQLKGVACAGSRTVWATCAAGIVASQDGGRSWALQTVPAAAASVAIAAADAGHIFATTSGQPLLASADGGRTWLACGTTGWLKQGLLSIAAVKADAAQ